VVFVVGIVGCGVVWGALIRLVDMAIGVSYLCLVFCESWGWRVN